VGEKTTANFIDDEAGTTPLAGSTVIAASLEVTDEIVRSPPPAFVTVTESVCVEPVKSSPKSTVVGLTENVPPTPVPDTATESRGWGPSCANRISPFFKPWLVGPKVTKKRALPRSGIAADGGATEYWLLEELTDDIVSVPGPPL
jgi:hypothetical protein